MSETESDKSESDQDRSRGDGWFNARLSSDEVAELTQNLSVLAEQGLPLSGGLAALAAEMPRGRLRRVLVDMSDRLERGQSLEDVIAAQGDRLPAHVRGLVLAGVRSGRLGDTLEQYVDHQNLAGEMRRRIWSALAYPLLLFAFALLLTVFLGAVVVPQFEAIYEDFEMELPLATTVVIEASHGIEWLVCGALVGVLVLWIVSRMTLSGPLQRRLVCRIPLVGPLWRYGALARFSHLAALLLESGIPWPVTLRWAAGASGDVDLADACHTIAREIESGRPLSASQTCQTRMPAGLGQILCWGEAQNSLPEALRTAGEMFEGRARTQTAFVVVVAPVIAIVATIGLVGFLVVSLFMPLIRLIETLGY